MGTLILASLDFWASVGIIKPQARARIYFWAWAARTHEVSPSSPCTVASPVVRSVHCERHSALGIEGPAAGTAGRVAKAIRRTQFNMQRGPFLVVLKTPSAAWRERISVTRTDPRAEMNIGMLQIKTGLDHLWDSFRFSDIVCTLTCR